jgi:predicted NAD-dependent protein-ADP-ribosyltransferase YbiA (DUF1768 family)
MGIDRDFDRLRTTEIAFTKVSLPFGWLGNMSPHPIQTTLSMYPSSAGIWRTAEALFQGYRFAPDDPIREEIRAQTSPMAAKMVAKREKDKMVIIPQSSEDLMLMKFVLELKIEQHPALAQELLATDDAMIIEGCTKRPHGSGLFWGAERAIGTDGQPFWRGSNNLGHLWMQVRDELRTP